MRFKWKIIVYSSWLLCCLFLLKSSKLRSYPITTSLVVFIESVWTWKKMMHQDINIKEENKRGKYEGYKVLNA